MEDRPPIEEATEQQIMNMINEKEYVNIICLMIPPRPGCQLFSVRLEHEYFKPDTSRNELFRMAIVKWQELSFMIINIPKEDEITAVMVAEECGLKFCKGRPVMIGTESPQGSVFPYFNEETCRTLENVRGHEVYKNQNHGELIKKEMMECEKILQKHMMELKKQGRWENGDL